MRHPRIILAALISVLVIACSGPPPAPQIQDVSPRVAMRGDTVTITGTNFGSDGTVTVGGAAATVSDWTASAIDVVVPDSAPNAWQPLTVKTGNGEGSIGEFFVGVEFDGPATDLQAFLDAQDEGVAVLLQADEYAFGSGNLVIEGRDLYGRGLDQTTLSFSDAMASGIHVQPGPDTSATAADMEIVTRNLILGRAATITPAPRHAPPAVTLGSQAAVTPDLTLSGLAVRDTGTTGALFTNRLLAAGQEMLMRDTTIELPIFDLNFNGGLKLEGVKIDNATKLDVNVNSGAISVLNSDLMVDGNVNLTGAAGLTIESSTVAAHDGDLTLNGQSAVPDGPGGPIEVRESVLEAFDADLSDGTRLGYIEIVTRDANVTLDRNERILSHAGLHIEVVGTATTDVQITGNPNVSAGFTVDGAVASPNADINLDLVIDSVQRSTLTVQDNVFLATEKVNFDTEGGNAVVSRNRFAAGDESTDGWVSFYFFDDSTVSVTDNEFAVRGGGAEIGGVSTASLELTSNTFDLTEVGSGMTIWDIGATTMANNTFSAVDADAASFALQMISMFEHMQLEASDNTFTGFENGILVSNDGGAATVFDVAVTRNLFDSEFGPGSTVVELRNVGQTIDATDNQWGDHIDIGVVENLVHRDPDTVSLGGSVDLDPIRVP